MKAVVSKSARRALAIAAVAGGLIAFSGAAAAKVSCTAANTLRADVAAIDIPMVFNRLGAQNVNWQMYALWRDLVVSSDSHTPLPALDGILSKGLGPTPFLAMAGNATLRPDLRPRPLTLRVSAGQCLHVRFINLLSPDANPHHVGSDLPTSDHPLNQRSHEGIANSDDQVAGRVAGFHPQGLELVKSIADDSSHVGRNDSSLAAPGTWREYWFHAPHEGAFLISNPGVVFGGEGTAGSGGTGLFGAVAVQPSQARAYRSQVTEEDLRLATRLDPLTLEPLQTPEGHPVIDYEALYPAEQPWLAEGKAGLPILAMVHKGEIVHAEVNAIIAGPNKDGSFPASTYPLEDDGKRNPTLPNRLEPFREFLSLFHDENAAAQAFPGLFDHSRDDVEDNPLVHTLHGVRDAFMINYGSAGIGAEIIANRLRVGPMHDCVDCAFEEFFLSAFAVGDPALLVDKPANFGLEGIKPVAIGATEEERQAMFGLPSDLSTLNLPNDSFGPKADHAFYPHDPANVHHSYLGDFVKFRNLHVGKEQHIFHLHNHQWLYNPNDDNSNYIDAQAIGPGSGYTYEIAFGGSGNRNRSVGDAIFHCHFYPHFAQGMWYLWRIHDVFEAGTRLEASDQPGPANRPGLERPERFNGFHGAPHGLAKGKPAKGARALPDGEIVAGTPIPAIVPLPGKALAPLPGKVEVVENPRKSPFNDERPIGSLARVEKTPDPTRPETEWQPERNPGYPFWIAGIEHTVGSRPTTPPLDMSPLPGSTEGGSDGGLPRHAVVGYSAKAESEGTFHRLSADKKEKKVRPVYFPEEGTGVERRAMAFHAQAEHLTSLVLPNGSFQPAVFRTNGAGPTPGAPFFDPCIDDRQRPLTTGQTPLYHNGKRDARSMVARQQAGDPSGASYFSNLGASPFDSERPRIYKGANIQLDVTFNKVGMHFGQQRILALWEDVGRLLDREQPPEPMVLRMNTFDCAVYLHANLVPKTYQLDDYQITTPTDVIGQHIHLPKWDLPSADGSANGWNYEDGTFSPGMVLHRIAAINAWNAAAAAPGSGEAPVPTLDGQTVLEPKAHPFFNHAQFGGLQLPDETCLEVWRSEGVDAFHNRNLDGYGRPRACDWFGARTTVQRWFSDPIINADHRHRGLGITFTHDHLGPSTHQQVGLYATMLTEPPGSVWRHNETGALLHDTATRKDGGPTSWQAVITGPNGKLDFDGDGVEDSHREFFLQFGDFQHAYRQGSHVGVDADGLLSPPTADSFRDAINPSHRKPADPNFPDIVAFEPRCPGSTDTVTIPRPCPEVISADDIGMMLVNYRNEPVAARVFDPDKTGPDGKPGAQADGAAGDLAFAYQSRTDRRIGVLNSADHGNHYPVDIHEGRLAGDPFTPILRAYSGDMVRLKIQAGSHEHEHNGTVHGLKWLQGGSGFGAAPTSGWRNSQNIGLSEQFTLSSLIVDYEAVNRNAVDRLWSIDASQDGLWNGAWGLARTLQVREADDRLLPLPQNPLPTLLSTQINPARPWSNDCGPLGFDKKPLTVRNYSIVAVLANEALGNSVGATIGSAPGLDSSGGTLVYNPRTSGIALRVEDEEGRTVETRHYGVGPLHDPTAILLVREEDYDFAKGRLKPGAPVEPLVLRAAAGDCVQVKLRNLLPRFDPMPDLDGFTTLTALMTRHRGSDDESMTGFNNNLIHPSNHIGLHPQLVHYDVTAGDGSVVGVNANSLVAPGGEKLYQWYAGGLEVEANDIGLCPAEERVDAVYRDFALLRAQTVRGPDGLPRLLRPTTDLNSPAAVGQRLISLVDQVQQPEPQRPTVQRRNEEPLRLPTQASESIRRALPGLNPDTLVFRRDSNLKANISNAALGESIAAVLTHSMVRACFDLAVSMAEPPNAVPTQVLPGIEAERKRQQGLAQLKERQIQSLAPAFVPDGAQPLGETALFDRLAVREQRPGRGQQPGSVQRLDREQCVFRLRADLVPGLAASLGALGEQRATVVANQLIDSFAYLVPGLDRDALADDERRRAFAWWQPAYPLPGPGRTNIVTLDGKRCRFEGIEFGGTNLTPPDPIKQGQKAAVGAFIILPEHSAWRERGDDDAFDHQDPGPDRSNRRPTLATANVLHLMGLDGGKPRFGLFRDLVAVHQKGLNLRYGDAQSGGGAVPGLAPERASATLLGAERIAPEDAHDAGQMAINYGTEPMWFRFGIAPDAPFGSDGLGGVSQPDTAFSESACCDGNPISPTITPSAGPPSTPVFKVPAGTQSRLRMLMPTGAGRGTTAHLHGHVWRRDPYLAKPSSGAPIASQCQGANPLAFWLGGQDSITPMAHFDWILDRTGGTNAIVGDFLLRDQAGFGITSGLWATVRSHGPDRRDPMTKLWAGLSGPLREDCQ